jgi:hypothetical protein
VACVVVEVSVRSRAAAVEGEASIEAAAEELGIERRRRWWRKLAGT